MITADELFASYATAPRCRHLRRAPGQRWTLHIGRDRWECPTCVKGLAYRVHALYDPATWVCDLCGEHPNDEIAAVALTQGDRVIIARACLGCTAMGLATVEVSGG